ncbi:hypothetical protein ACH5RR_032902 [Cinchona calisaya]|uniref:Disease resistance protein At1g50180 n=1 Tax=Cinchona calisaya TaxID=153742 RepID=A0ABD2YNK9_9GENT
MSVAIISTVLSTLHDVLVEEAKFLSGVTDQVEEVSKELKRMQCFLRDAETRHCEDESVRNWLREIRSLAYRIEDAVETFAIKVASKRSSSRRGHGKKVLNRYLCLLGESRSLHNRGLEISKVKTDINNLTTSLQRYGIKAITESGESSSTARNQNQQYSRWWIQQTYPYEVEEYFVGMQEDIKQLVSHVVDDDKRYRVISIWGMGGLGKTTLARKIYKHMDVQRCFQHFAWACVTQQGQIRSIIQDVFLQLNPEKQEEVKCMGDRELVQQLYEFQKGKKCLIVLDNVWKLEEWKSLVASFNAAQGLTKILLTTRNRKVAEIGFTYELKCLNEEESWELLQKIAFSRKNAEDFKMEPNLRNVGIEIVHKCGGLPLAISVLGGILKEKKDSLTEWQIVNKYIGSYLSKGEDDAKGGAVARILSLSYNDLPYHLKPCFLYMSSFREYEDIEAEQLYLLWMAEGMVLSQHRRSGETLMEIAEGYLDELVQRSMVQVQMLELPIAGARRFVSCRLHDMMRDLCLQKGREEEFIRVVDFRGRKMPFVDSLLFTNINAYRLVIHIDEKVEGVADSIFGQEDYLYVRSLLCINEKSRFWEKVITWPQVVHMRDFKLLRVLKFEGFDFCRQRLPVELRKLIHLRLLSLKCCKLDELPSSTAFLPSLETLDLQVNNGIKVPNIFWKMKRLRHLYLNDQCWTETRTGKLQLHGLSELETLVGLDSNMYEISDLSELTNLRYLTVRVVNNESLQATINHISLNGQKLWETILHIRGCYFGSSKAGTALFRRLLTCGNLHHLFLDARVIKFPEYEHQFLQSLVQLILIDNKIEEDPMKTLGKLPQLRILLLESNAYIGNQLTCHQFGFPKLIALRLLRLPNLEFWRVYKGAMPNLCGLQIQHCRRLIMIPDGLRFIVGLKDLEIHGMPLKFCDRVRLVDGREGMDFDKIRHVPSVSIGYPF